MVKQFTKSIKLDKTQTIIGLDLQDNILIGEFRTALGATHCGWFVKSASTNTLWLGTLLETT